jgi:hypothetical protein
MSCSQITGTVAESYNTLRPYTANVADIGSISVTGDRAAVFPQALEINGIKCELGFSLNQGA